LTSRIESLSGLGMHERSLAKDKYGKPKPRDDIGGYPRRWNERAVVVDDAAYSLAAVGKEAIPALTSLLGAKDPWVVINALFALGEIGPAARHAMPQVIRLLEHPKQQVVRQALDTLGAIGGDIGEALPQIHALLQETNPNWQSPEVGRGWTGQDQVRLNAVLAILSCLNEPANHASIESILIASLDDPNGYVPAVATEALVRLGSKTGIEASVRYLQDRRWDDTLIGRVKPY
ncbi:MAG: HEAT repeat domain-containing protein, partial [Pseudomonadales bacterium]|nr:HEAT repeat domain-containing protein [Pseudomonadales bacterium]